MHSTHITIPAGFHMRPTFSSVDLVETYLCLLLDNKIVLHSLILCSNICTLNSSSSVHSVQLYFILCTKFVTLYLVVQMMTHFKDEIIKADFFPILKITLYISRGSFCQGFQNMTLSTIFPHSRLHTTWTVYFFLSNLVLLTHLSL